MSGNRAFQKQSEDEPRLGDKKYSTYIVWPYTNQKQTFPVTFQ